MASENPPSFDASDTLRIRKGDYVSPGLRIIVPDECFPRMKEGDISYGDSALCSMWVALSSTP